MTGHVRLRADLFARRPRHLLILIARNVRLSVGVTVAVRERAREANRAELNWRAVAVR